MSIDNLSNITKLITQGVYVISVKHKEQLNAFTAAWVMQVSFTPPLLCFSINPNHRSYDILQKGKNCCISILSDKQLIEASHFGQSSKSDKMKNFSWLKFQTGSPALANSLAYFNCTVSHYADAGDHYLVICEITGAKMLSNATPMRYIQTQNMDNSNQLYKN